MTAVLRVGLGSSLLPLLLPLLLNGFLVPFSWAVATAALAPIVSGLLTGMPPFYPPIALMMSAEATVLSGVAAIVYRLTRPRVWPALAAAIVLGRSTMVGLTWQLAGSFGLPPTLSAVALIVQGLPGVLLQCAVVPVAVRLLRERRSLLLPQDRDEQAPVL